MNFKIYLLLCLISLLTARKRLNTDATSTQKKNTVVESNHFYSNWESETNYQINSITKGKSLIYLLKQNTNKKALSLSQNPIKITLKQKQQQESCEFKSINNMCAFKEADGSNLHLNIHCQKAPCQLSWIILQPAAVIKEGQHKIQELVYLSDNHHHSSLIVICNDPSVQKFGDEIKLYTNSQYERIQSARAIYYLFEQQKKGYYYITSNIDKVKNCANVSIKNTNNTISFNNQNNDLFQDFVKIGSTNTYEIQKIPSTDFRIDAFYHAAKNVMLNQSFNLQMSLLGQKNGEKTKIQTNAIPGHSRYAVDFNIIYKKVSSQFSKIYLQVKNNGKEVVLVSMDFKAMERQELSIDQQSFFWLKKGQKISYKFMPVTGQSNANKNVTIQLSNQTRFKSSVQSCKLDVGCQFQLQALSEGEGKLTVTGSNSSNTTDATGTTVITSTKVLQFKDSITHRVRQGQTLLLKKIVKQKGYFQATVNTPNVLIYASSKSKCQFPSKDCHEKVLNYHNPFIYQHKVKDEIYFAVQGLDTCTFTLNTISKDTEYIKLEDTKPFTYLLDDGQKQLLFKFSLKKKEGVSFNLIAPLNQLNLIVTNGDSIDDGQSDASSDGYITFKQDDINGLNFIVKVQKRQQFFKKFIHFTLLVSTHQGNVRLQPSVAHYETIGVSQTRDYVFQFQPKKDILINFYTHNLLKDINIKAILSKADQYEDQDNIIQFTIDSQSDILDLKNPAQQLCGKQTINCQLYLRLSNQLDVQIDITLTLMMKESIIQLKDGVWNSYKASQITKNTHFYFLPKHQNKTVAITYQAEFVDMKIMYSIFKTDDKLINPSLWPFPQRYKQNQTAKSPLLSFHPTKIIHIDNTVLKSCWPYCVVLLSVFEDTGVKGKFNNYLSDHSFKIMASNNYIQLPQKHKVDIVMKKNEIKHLLVDLKYVMNKKALTFFTYFTIGQVQLKGNTYDDNNPRCPNQQDISDFKFGNLQTQISLETIKNKLKQNQMSQDEHPYICIMVKSLADSKFTIQYDSDQQVMTNIKLDSFYIQKLQPGEINIAQADATQQFRIKVTRTQGYPYLATKVCTQGEDFQGCLQDFKKSTEKGLQIVDKMITISQQPCKKCILFLKFQSQQSALLDIHSQSKYSQTEISEGKMIFDQVVKQQQNKYLITSVKDQQLVINIQITHGQINASLTDFGGIKIDKQNKKDQNFIRITVPTINKNKQKKQSQLDSIWGKTFFSSFAQSIFANLHLTIKNSDPKSKSVYTISYSSGQYVTYLQDGLISSFGLEAQKQTKFIYNNPSLSKIYLLISTSDADFLNKIKIKVFAMSDPNDQQSGTEMTPEKVNFNKKTPKPTMIIGLPANKMFVIKINNPQKQYQLITIGINNQQVIFLPTNIDFPVPLAANQHVYFIINFPFYMNLSLTIKKCDQSQLQFSYTFNYNQFTNDVFQNTNSIPEQQLLFNTIIKSKNYSSVYVKVKAPQDNSAIFTIFTALSFDKHTSDKPKAGQKGQIQYHFVNSNTIQATFAPLLCPLSSPNCQKDYSFSSLLSDKMQNIYAQLVCPSIAFDLQDRKSVQSVKTVPIHAALGGKISFNQTISKDIHYLGIKAVNNKTGQILYYKPIQIATLWGQIQKNSRHGGILFVFLMIIGICCCLVCYRRSKKGGTDIQKGYAPLASID